MAKNPARLNRNSQIVVMKRSDRTVTYMPCFKKFLQSRGNAKISSASTSVWLDKCFWNIGSLSWCNTLGESLIEASKFGELSFYAFHSNDCHVWWEHWSPLSFNSKIHLCTFCLDGINLIDPDLKKLQTRSANSQFLLSVSWCDCRIENIHQLLIFDRKNRREEHLLLLEATWPCFIDFE